MEAHESKFGKGTAKVINHNDYTYGKSFSNVTRELYNKAHSGDTPKLQKFFNSLGFYGTYPLARTPKKSQVTDLIRKENPGRVIVTHPDSVNAVRQTGIKPEVAITDYGVNNKGNKAFWNFSRGLVLKDDLVGKAYAPSSEGVGIIKNTPSQEISNIPISRSQYITPKRESLKEFTI